MNGAGAQEQERLEDRVVQCVIQPRNQRHSRHRRMPQRPENHRRAKPNQDDPDVLDAVVRQQALQIVLHQRIQHAQQRRQHARSQDQDSRPRRRRVEEIEEYQRHPVDAGLDHDAGH